MSADLGGLSPVARRMVEMLQVRPLFFYDLCLELGDVPYREILQAWGEVRERCRFGRDEDGHYILQE
ncbi:MAG: hypothetical protein HYY85_01235 [Deltaproteobacteria bacterium]|nr:hypothetical protein [Deltaproteobacteria bacterium]